MLVSNSGSSTATNLGYRFAGVIVDVQRARLLVDGQEVAVGALPLKLLRTLCAADGALVNRNTLFEQIWPRQVITDEALSKLIGRTRELLGPYGATLVTVRGQGVRLDATVSPQPDLPRAPAPAAPIGLVAPVAEPEAKSALRAVSVVVAVVAAAILVFVLWPKADPLVSAGYAMHASDLQASKAETADLVRAAFAASMGGEIVHARTMMRSAHASDPTTPVPALMLAWWEANASPDSAQHWISAARQRLRADSSAYLRLMVEYFGERSGAGDVRGPINALLDLRPQAWSLQYARAHDQLGNREFAGALKSLQQIPLDIPDADQVAEVLADRVSLGDTAAVALVTPAIKADAVIDACTQGRFAYSHAEFAASIAAFDRCRETAEARRDYVHARDGAMFAALAALEAGKADAVQRIDGAARLCHEQNVQSCEVEMLGLRAFLEARAGQTEAAGATLTDAWQHNLWEWAKPPLLLVALENGLPVPANPAEVAKGVSRDTVFGGVADLLLAWQAFAAGDKAGARNLLDRAREHGVAQTYHAEDAVLLGARLGDAAVPCRVDPPYPNQLRLSACVAINALQRH